MTLYSLHSYESICRISVLKVLSTGLHCNSIVASTVQWPNSFWLSPSPWLGSILHKTIRWEQNFALLSTTNLTCKRSVSLLFPCRVLCISQSLFSLPVCIKFSSIAPTSVKSLDNYHSFQCLLFVYVLYECACITVCLCSLCLLFLILVFASAFYAFSCISICLCSICLFLHFYLSLLYMLILASLFVFALNAYSFISICLCSVCLCLHLYLSLLYMLILTSLFVSASYAYSCISTCICLCSVCLFLHLCVTTIFSFTCISIFLCSSICLCSVCLLSHLCAYTSFLCFRHCCLSGISVSVTVVSRSLLFHCFFVFLSCHHICLLLYRLLKQLVPSILVCKLLKLATHQVAW